MPKTTQVYAVNLATLSEYPDDTEIVLATGGQMIVRPAVCDDSKLRAGAAA